MTLLDGTKRFVNGTEVSSRKLTLFGNFDFISSGRADEPDIFPLTGPRR